MSTRWYDLIVVGGGTGRDIVLAGREQGIRVALVEQGPLGGTCHNRGCMPSKMLIHSADIADAARSGERFGVHTRIERIDLSSMVRNVFAELDAETEEREEDLRSSPNVDFLQEKGRFVGQKTMEVGGERISADKIVIAGGSRPSVIPFPGLESVPYLTSDEALHLETLPRHLAIIGGGYIASELAHFFGSLGSEISLITIEDRLLEREDREIAEWFTRANSEKYNVLLSAHVEGISSIGDQIEVRLKSVERPILADQLLIATGRKPNTDLLNVEALGVELDRGIIKVNEYMETNVEGIWAFGDIVGIMPLKHVAVRQAKHLIQALFFGDKRPMDYRAIPHAVFGSPQVAGVGKTEEQLRDEGIPYRVGLHEFKNSAMGMALKESGLVKVLASASNDILGAHIVGPNASILIQEVVVAMITTGKLDAIIDSVHAHPALSQVIEQACKAVAPAPVFAYT